MSNKSLKYEWQWGGVLDREASDTLRSEGLEGWLYADLWQIGDDAWLNTFRHLDKVLLHD